MENRIEKITSAGILNCIQRIHPLRYTVCDFGTVNISHSVRKKDQDTKEEGKQRLVLFKETSTNIASVHVSHHPSTGSV